VFVPLRHEVPNGSWKFFVSGFLAVSPVIILAAGNAQEGDEQKAAG
jgi:hypothetical protein